jgi:outer membrane protein assembly factor BamD
MTLVLTMLVLLAGCAKPQPAPPTPVQRLEEVRRLARRGAWAKALPALQALVFELSGGRPEAPEVSYLTGEALFQTASYADAAEQFRKVSEAFPESPYAPLALLRAGDANMRMWRRPQLDPTYGEVALATYQELSGRYPDSEAAARGNLHVRRLRAWLAEKAYRNGLFYLRRKAYDSAILYFREVVAAFSDTPWTPHALLRLVDSYAAIGYNEERKETCDHLRRFFPRTAVAPEKCPPAAPAPPAADASP